MRFRLLIAAAVLCTAGTCARAAETLAPFHVGETTRVFRPAAVRNWRGAKTQALVATVWYPVDAALPEAKHKIGPPGVAYFEGHTLTAAGAPLAPLRARYPLIVISHGTAGSADSLDWIASALAASGYIVVGVNHPGNNALEPLTWSGFSLLWERATDLSEVIDGVLSDPLLSPRIDPARIGAAGFSLGGYTVLELAGARTNMKKLETFCRGPSADGVCHPPEFPQMGARPEPKVPVSSEDRASLARSGASYRDPRIKAVFALAPSMIQAFDAESLWEVRVPIEVIAGTGDINAPAATNASQLAALYPAVRLTLVPGAGHYTFLSSCGAAMEHLDPALCHDNAGVDREAVHATAIEKALAFFEATLR